MLNLVFFVRFFKFSNLQIINGNIEFFTFFQANNNYSLDAVINIIVLNIWIEAKNSFHVNEYSENK